MTEQFDWEKWVEEKRKEDAEYGGGLGIKCMCQNCGFKTKIRLQRGCSVKATVCPKCGMQRFKRKPINESHQTKEEDCSKNCKMVDGSCNDCDK